MNVMQGRAMFQVGPKEPVRLIKLEMS
jgi:hypothetical protein